MIERYEKGLIRTDRGLHVDKGNQVFDVLHPDFGAKLNGLDDDGYAFSLCADEIQANGEGVFFVPHGRALLFSVGTTYTQIAHFQNLENVVVRAGNAELMIDPARSGEENKFTTSYGSVFRFTACRNIGVHVARTTGPEVLDDSGSVKGIVLVHFYEGCENITIPSLECDGGLVAAVLLDKVADPDGDEIRNINIGILKVSNCWYGIGAVYAGHNVEIGTLDTDNVFRALIGYGMDNWNIEVVRAKNPQGGHITLECVAGHGVENFYIGKYIDKESDTPGDHPRIQFVWIDTTPGTFRNIDIGLDVELVQENDKGQSVVIITKLDGAGGFDTTGRGHVFKHIRIGGRVNGNPPTLDNGVIGTHASCAFDGDEWDDLELDLDIEDARYMLFQTAGFVPGGKGIRCRVRSDDLVAFPTSSADTQIGNVKIDWTGSSFPNLYEDSGGHRPVASRTAAAASVDIPSDWMYDDSVYVGTHSPVDQSLNLPAGAMGMAKTFMQNGNNFLLEPNGAEQHRGGGAGKYLKLGAAGSVARVRWTGTVWDLEYSAGTITYEP